MRRTDEAPDTEDLLQHTLNLLDRLSHRNSANPLVLIGLLALLLSLMPLLAHLTTPSALYGVLFGYSCGMAFTSRFLSARFPWTTRMLDYLTLGILPLNYLTLLTLPQDLTGRLAAVGVLGILPLLSVQALRRSCEETPIPYVIALWGSGCVLPLTLDIPLWAGLLISMSLSFVGYRALFQSREIPHRLAAVGAKAAYLWAHLALLPLFYNGELWHWGLVLVFTGLLCFALARKLSAWVVLEQRYQKAVYAQDAVALLCWLSAALTFSPWPLLQSLVALCITALGFQYALKTHAPEALSRVYRLSCGVTGLAFGGIFLPVIGAFLAHHADGMAFLFSLLLALFTLSVGLLRRHRPYFHWNAPLAHSSLSASVLVWGLLAHYGDWSWAGVLSLLILGSVYLYHAYFTDTRLDQSRGADVRRHTLSYGGLSSILLAILSASQLIWPVTELESYRYVLMGLAWSTMLLGLIHQTFTKHTSQHDHWQKVYREPAYNLALFMASLALLMRLEDMSMMLVGGLFYTLSFKVYPSRMWLYLAITTFSDSLLAWSNHMLPERYHSMSLLTLTLGWFFVGTLIEELLHAQDQLQPDAAYTRQKRFAQPFFHGALALNLLLLQQIWGDLHTLFEPTGWQRMSEHSLPILLTGLFYTLKMRVYVSKLWLYPGIMTTTLGLYFALGQWLPAESLLLHLSLIGLFWWELSRYVSQHAGIQRLWQEVIVRRRPNTQDFEPFYQTHLADFASPLRVTGGIILGFSLLLSLALIPYRPLELEQIMALAFLRAEAAPQVYLFQICNFALLTLSFMRMGKGGILLSALATSGGVLWLVQEQSTQQQLPFVFAAVALFWSLIWWSFRQECTPLHHKYLHWISNGLLLLSSGLLLPEMLEQRGTRTLLLMACTLGLQRQLLYSPGQRAANTVALLALPCAFMFTLPEYAGLLCSAGGLTALYYAFKHPKPEAWSMGLLHLYLGAYVALLISAHPHYGLMLTTGVLWTGIYLHQLYKKQAFRQSAWSLAAWLNMSIFIGGYGALAQHAELNSLFASGAMHWLSIHIQLWLPGVTLILLARYVEQKKLHRRQLAYVGFTLCMVHPMVVSSLGLFALSRYSAWTLVGYAEALILPLCMMVMGFRWRWKTPLQTGLLGLGFLASLQLAQWVFLGHWLLRWGLLVGLGILFMAAGSGLQQHHQRIRRVLRQWRQQFALWQ